MENLSTKIGLEIHVQLKTKSKMFCRCDNFAENAAPNTLVCPVCLGLPGALPVANRTAIEWTIKTGLALHCDIPVTAKFDRKHYFYPDLPKGYQISQYDEPFCKGGYLEIRNPKSEISFESERKGRSLDLRVDDRNKEEVVQVRLNRIHLEEDAGKLIHKNGDSLVDLNRAGTPLMEIVTEPDITSPKMAGDFLRALQKIVRDVVEVSEASMEKGHLRCDANISVNRDERQETRDKGPAMSQIIEIKNLNSFRFVEKALLKAEEKLSSEYQNWSVSAGASVSVGLSPDGSHDGPAKPKKETWGYNSVTDSIYLQRTKEEAADYRYFPEPDLPPIKSAEFDLVGLKGSTKETHEIRAEKLKQLKVPTQYIEPLISNQKNYELFQKLIDQSGESIPEAARLVIQKFLDSTLKYRESQIVEFAKLIRVSEDLHKKALIDIIQSINSGLTFEDAIKKVGNNQSGEPEISVIIEKVLAENPAEVERYKKGEIKLISFFMGVVMKETKGSADPQLINSILRKQL